MTSHFERLMVQFPSLFTPDNQEWWATIIEDYGWDVYLGTGENVGTFLTHSLALEEIKRRGLIFVD